MNPICKCMVIIMAGCTCLTVDAQTAALGDGQQKVPGSRANVVDIMSGAAGSLNLATWAAASTGHRAAAGAGGCGDGVCNPGAPDSDCCIPNGTPGCSIPECEACVCGIDPFCCDVEWDSICVGEATDICVSECGCSGSDCCEANGTPGCSDPECEAIVCGMDPFCCDTEWDGICAGEAAIFCDLCGESCENCPEDCGACSECGDGVCESGSNCCTFTGPPGCSDPVCEACVCAIAPFCCDVSWGGNCGNLASDPNICGPECLQGCTTFEHCGNCPADCGECPSCECSPGAIDEGEACGESNNNGCASEFTNAACGDTFCGTAWAINSTRDIDWYVVDHPGGTLSATLTAEFPAFLRIINNIQNCGELFPAAIGCSADCAPIAEASAVLPAGQYAVAVAAGTCDAGAIFEGFPCGSANDYQLTINCTDPCGNGVCDSGTPGSDCCAPNGTPGCTDPNCEACVCTVEPFCCDVEWDNVCVQDVFFSCAEECVDNCAIPATEDCSSCPEDCGSCDESLIIKQGACPAPVNLGGSGVVPMALVGDDDFDVSQVNLATLQLHLCGGEGGIAPLNGPPGPQIEIEDLNHPFAGNVNCDGGACACNPDQSADGMPDLELKFSMDDLAALLGEESGVITLELTGQLNDGTGFSARDCVSITPEQELVQTSLNVESNVSNTFVTIEPLDLNLDSDGFANFGRAYSAGTLVQLAAPEYSQGRSFAYWLVDGVVQTPGQNLIEMTVSQDSTARAVYQYNRTIVDPGNDDQASQQDQD